MTAQDSVIRIRIPLTPLSKVASSIGVDSHQYHDSFEIVKTETPYPVVHGGGETVRSSMLVKPNAYAVPKTEKARELFSTYAGRVLVPDRIWWDTARVIALYSEEPVLSNIFYAVRLNIRDDEVRGYAEKALALWLNTTWGILTVLLSREETRGRWTRLKMWQWQLLKVLDVATLDPDTLRKLATVFDNHASKSPGRIPDQFDPRKPDPARVSIDRDFVKAFNPSVDDEALENRLRELYKRVHISLQQWIGG